MSTVVLGVRRFGSDFIGLTGTYPRCSNQFRVTRRLRSYVAKVVAVTPWCSRSQALITRAVNSPTVLTPVSRTKWAQFRR